MALETKDINNAADMQRYVEGCLNDLMEGLSTKDETMKYLHDYTLRVIDITAKCVGINLDTSDEALHIGSVGGALPESSGERINFFLVNVMRYLDQDGLASLTETLFERLSEEQQESVVKLKRQ